MRWRNLIVALTIFGLLGWLAMLVVGQPSGQAVLPTTVVAYFENPDGVKDVLVADARFVLPPGFCLTAPHLEVLVQDASGWRRIEAGTWGSSAIPSTPLNLNSSGKNRMAILLPSDTRSWHLLLSGRLAGLGTRCSVGLGSWAQDSSGTVSPVWRWLVQRLPNSPGRPVLLKSKVLPVQEDQHPPSHNHWAQAMPVCTFMIFLGSCPGVPGPDRYMGLRVHLS